MCRGRRCMAAEPGSSPSRSRSPALPAPAARTSCPGMTSTGGPPVDYTVYKHGYAPYVLPFLEQEAVFRLYRFDLFWSDPANQAAVSAPLKVFACPASPGTATVTDSGFTFGRTDYVAIYGVDPDLVTSGLLGTWNGDINGVLGFGQAFRMPQLRTAARLARSPAHACPPASR